MERESERERERKRNIKREIERERARERERDSERAKERGPANLFMILQSPSHNSEAAWFSLGPMSRARSRSRETPFWMALLRDPLHRAREVLLRELSREMALNNIRTTLPPAHVQERKLMIKNIHRVLREESSHRVVIMWTMILIDHQDLLIRTYLVHKPPDAQC